MAGEAQELAGVALRIAVAGKTGQGHRPAPADLFGRIVVEAAIRADEEELVHGVDERQPGSRASTGPIEGESALAQPCTWTTVSAGRPRRAGREAHAPPRCSKRPASRRRACSWSNETSSWPRQTTSIPASGRRGSTGPTAANSVTAWPRSRRARANSIATLACPPLMWAWSRMRTMCKARAPLRADTLFAVRLNPRKRVPQPPPWRRKLFLSDRNRRMIAT